MGKTYEALARAEKEYQENLLRTSRKGKNLRVVAPPKRLLEHVAPEAYEELNANLLTRYDDRPIKRIVFAGTSRGVGCTTTAINFAIALSNNSNFKVLLIDANLRTPSVHDVFKIDHTPGLSDLLSNNTRMSSTFNKVGPENLYILPCGGYHSGSVNLYGSNGFDQFLKTVSEQFDYLILDVPAITAFPESRVICSKVDGVIMVLMSGRTRLQVALRAKQALEDTGGKILGVVLNRKKHYIPEWLYKRI